MKCIGRIIFGLMMISNVHANDSFSSEMSHFLGGGVMAGGITAIVDSYYPEYRDDRSMIGFGISSAVIIVEQSLEFAFNGNAKGQLMDVAFHIAGSALGTFITDEYFLSPVINQSSIEGKYIGLTLQRTF